jgi:hypothetical protein
MSSKKLTLIIFSFLFLSTSIFNTNILCAKNHEELPPDSIKKAFNELFPNAINPKWTVNESNKNQIHLVHFIHNKMKIKASFANDGSLIETEKEFKEKDLPENVLKTLETQFQKFKIVDCKIIEYRTTQLYQLEIKSDGVTSSIVIGKDGYITSR